MRPLPRSPGPAPSPTGPRRGPMRLRAVLLVAVLLIAGWPAPAPAESPRWRWPLPAPHPVVTPFEAPESRYGPGHRGIDIATTAGAPVRAVGAGTVRFSGSVAGRGVVSVLHADGLISTYEPVDGVVETGSGVRAGTVLGTIASAGAASHCEPSRCLHLGARHSESYLDPLLLLGVRGPSVLLPWSGGPDGQGSSVPRPDGGAGLPVRVPAGAREVPTRAPADSLRVREVAEPSRAPARASLR